MKQTIVFVIGLMILTVSVQAQDFLSEVKVEYPKIGILHYDTPLISDSEKENYTLFNIGAVLVKRNPFGDSSFKSTIPPLVISIDRQALLSKTIDKSWFTAGGSFAISLYKHEFNKDLQLSLFTFGGSVGLEIDELVNDLAEGFNFPDRLDLYANLQVFYDYYLFSDQYSGVLSRSFKIGGVFGARYFFTKKMGLYAEVGAVEQGSVQAGVSIRF